VESEDEGCAIPLPPCFAEKSPQVVENKRKMLKKSAKRVCNLLKIGMSSLRVKQNLAGGEILKTSL
jgi:hypothetical protein